MKFLSKKSLFIAAIPALALLALALAFSDRIKGVVPPAERSVLHKVMVSSPQRPKNQEKPQVANNQRTIQAEAIERQYSTSEIVNKAESKYEAYSQLLQGAEGGRLDYIYAVRDIEATCGESMLSGELFNDVVPASIQEQPEWAHAVGELRTWCGPRTALDERVAAVTEDLFLKVSVLAERGDKLAMMYDAFQTSKNSLRLSQEDSFLALDVLRSDASGETVVRAANALVNMSENKEVQGMDQSIFGGAFSQAEVEKIKFAAVMFYACRHDRYCGPAGHYQRDGCLFYGWCDQSMSVPEYIREYELSEPQYRLAQRYATQLQSYIEG